MRTLPLGPVLLKILLACGVAVALFIYLTLPVLSHAIGRFLHASQQQALDRTRAISIADSGEEWATQSTGPNVPEHAWYYRDGTGLLLAPGTEQLFTFPARCPDAHYLNVAALAEGARLNVWVDRKPWTSLHFTARAPNAITAESAALPNPPRDQRYYVTLTTEHAMHLDGVSITCAPQTTPWWVHAFARFTEFEPHFRKPDHPLDGLLIRYDSARDWARLVQPNMDFEFSSYYRDGQGVSVRRGASIRIPLEGCSEAEVRLGVYASSSFPLEVRSSTSRAPIRFYNAEYQLVTRDISIRKQRDEVIEIRSPDYSHLDFIGLQCKRA